MEVDVKRMRANLDLTHGLVVSEAVMMGLAPYIGREYAHDLVYDICRVAIKEERALLDLLAENAEITKHVNREQLAAMCDPAAYLGQSGRDGRSRAAALAGLRLRSAVPPRTITGGPRFPEETAMRSRRFLPLRRGALLAAKRRSLSLPALLLHHLPQDAGRWRLRHQPWRRRCQLEGQRPQGHLGLSRPDEGARRQARARQHGRAPFLRSLRQRAVALQPGVAGADPPLRVGHRHAAAGAAAAHPPDAGIQGAVGGGERYGRATSCSTAIRRNRSRSGISGWALAGTT